VAYPPEPLRGSTSQAGVRRVFIGLENINPDNLMAANKRQNKITDCRIMLQKWRQHGALIYAGYILGFPGDTKESIKTYPDLAIAPPAADEFEALDLYHATAGGEAARERKRRDEAIRAGAHSPIHPQGSAAAVS
jgi:hypothetical protein